MGDDEEIIDMGNMEEDEYCTEGANVYYIMSKSAIDADTELNLDNLVEDLTAAGLDINKVSFSYEEDDHSDNSLTLARGFETVAADHDVRVVFGTVKTTVAAGENTPSNIETVKEYKITVKAGEGSYYGHEELDWGEAGVASFEMSDPGKGMVDGLTSGYSEDQGAFLIEMMADYTSDATVNMAKLTSYITDYGCDQTNLGYYADAGAMKFGITGEGTAEPTEDVEVVILVGTVNSDIAAGTGLKASDLTVSERYKVTLKV